MATKNSFRDQALKVLSSENGHPVKQADIAFGEDIVPGNPMVAAGKMAKADRAYVPGEVFPEQQLGLGITAQIMWVTVEVAKGFLASREKRVQRALVSGHLKALKDTLASVGFSINGETIVLDWFGRMIDGQHRCEAVVSSGKPYMSVVIRGIDPKAYETIGQGAKKQASYILKTKGVKNYSTAASAAHILLRYQAAPNFPPINSGSTLIVDLVEGTPEMEESVTVGCACREIYPSVGAAAALHFLFRKVDQALADDMFQKLITGANMSIGHPVLSLRTSLIHLKNEKKGTMHYFLAITIKAWNLLRQGKKGPKRIEHKLREEAFPTIL